MSPRTTMIVGLALLGGLVLATGPHPAHASGQDAGYVVVLRADALAPGEGSPPPEDEPPEVRLPVIGYTWKIETPEPGSFGAGRTPPPEKAHLTILKAVDDLSPALVEALESQAVIPDLELRPEGAAGSAYRLVDVKVRKVAVKGDVEEVTFGYRRAEAAAASATDPDTEAPHALSGR